VGQRYTVTFMEAESEDEVRELLKELPFGGWGHGCDRAEELRRTAALQQDW
jgi:hypothetical protein